MEIAEKVPHTRAGSHLAGQLIRSGSSPALHYGEVRSAESRKDFLHKVQVLLKELRETHICLKIIQKKPYFKSINLAEAVDESNQLIAIFVASLKTARTKTRIAA